MLPVRKVLCTTDFSDPSYHGVRTADEIARHFGAELIVVHITNPVPVPSIEEVSASTTRPFDIEGYKRMLRESAGMKLKSAVWNACREPETVRRILREGNPAERIVAVADEEGVDLIVTATHGHTGVRRFMLGSTAEKVVRTAHRPVLTVHLEDEASWVPRAKPSGDGSSE